MLNYSPTNAPAIKLTGVVQTFGDVVAVNGISLTIQKGAVFALLGANGAGKTTLVKTLTTLLPPREGVVMIDGINIYEDLREARQRFGVVFQGSSLDDEMSPLEHMDMHAAFYGVPRKVARDRGDQLLHSFELWQMRHERAKNFSGGERRKLEIARAFLHNPSVLFLDEPTVGLDAAARRNLWTLIHRIRSERELTVLLTTHYLEEAEVSSTHVAIMDKGTLVAEGSPDSLIAEAAVDTLEAAFLSLMDRRQEYSICDADVSRLAARPQ